MQEPQHRIRAEFCASVHLLRPTARRDGQLIDTRAGTFYGIVIAAAIDDDEFMSVGTQWLKIVEQRIDVTGLIEGRDDDRQPSLSTVAVHTCQESAPPQLDPCPAVQP